MHTILTTYGLGLQVELIDYAKDSGYLGTGERGIKAGMVVVQCRV